MASMHADFAKTVILLRRMTADGALVWSEPVSGRLDATLACNGVALTFQVYSGAGNNGRIVVLADGVSNANNLGNTVALEVAIRDWISANTQGNKVDTTLAILGIVE